MPPFAFMGGAPAGWLMRQVGYDDAMIERVKKAVGKRGIKSNPDRRCWRMSPAWSSGQVEDGIC